MNLRRATFSATRWTSAATLIRITLQVAQTVILARLLEPRDFGLMAMAGVAMAIASLFSDLGLGSALMHFPRPEQRTLSTLYWLNLGTACCLGLLFALLAWPIALAYRQSELLPVLGWLSLMFPLAALGQPFRILAEKELQFARVARVEVASSLLGFIVAIAAALAGSGVLALVCAPVTSAAANSLLSWLRLSAGVRPTNQFSLPLARPFLSFGMHRVGGDLWNTLQMQLDVLIAGFFASPAGVALYAVPREQCLRIANAGVNPVVTRVGLPVMSKLQNEPAALRSVYLQMLRLTASINFPLYAFLALFPEQIVVLLLGPQWHDAAFYLRLFAVWGLIRSTGNPAGSLMYAMGLARRVHVWNLAQLVVTAPVLWIAATTGGLSLLAWSLCALQVVIFFLAWRFLIWPACGANLIEYSASVMPPIIATIVASLLALMMSRYAPTAWQLPMGAVALGLSYLVFSWWLNRSWLRAMVELGEPLWKRVVQHP